MNDKYVYLVKEYKNHAVAYFSYEGEETGRITLSLDGHFRVFSNSVYTTPETFLAAVNTLMYWYVTHKELNK